MLMFLLGVIVASVIIDVTVIAMCYFGKRYLIDTLLDYLEAQK